MSTLLMMPVAYYWPIQASYHPLNTDWNGCSVITSAATKPVLMYSYDKGIPRGSILAILGPSLPFSSSEGTIIRDYLENNGTLLLADDFGTGNSLLEKLNVSVRFSGRPLADIYAYNKNPSFLLVSDFLHGPLTRGVGVVILDHPSFLQMNKSKEVRILASSSPFSFIDTQGSGKPYYNESIASYPVMAYTHVGTGSIIIISNAALFINDVVGLYDNMQFFENILNVSGNSLVLDVSHLANAPLTDTLLAAKNTLNTIAILAQGNIFVQAIVIMLILVVALPLRSHRPTKKAVVTVTFYTLQGP